MVTNGFSYSVDFREHFIGFIVDIEKMPRNFHLA